MVQLAAILMQQICPVSSSITAAKMVKLAVILLKQKWSNKQQCYRSKNGQISSNIAAAKKMFKLAAIFLLQKHQVSSNITAAKMVKLAAKKWSR